MGKIPKFTNSEQLKTPKMDCVLKVYKDKEFYQLGLSGFSGTSLLSPTPSYDFTLPGNVFYSDYLHSM